MEINFKEIKGQVRGHNSFESKIIPLLKISR
jgi:hypothetical protein